MSSNVKTRILIVSDTHGTKNVHDAEQLPTCDLAIHCSDLTNGSKLEEYQTTLRYLCALRAPLKLVIAGNHDFTMDESAFQRKLADEAQPLDPELVAKQYGTPGQARKMFEVAKESGIVFLDEGVHRYTLTNGAQVSVYASPYTPSMGQWGFQYHPDKGHKFDIDDGVDIAVTHGPPRGVLDYTYGRERAGCSDLFTAITKAKPKIHCFGHVHEGWGAKIVAWKEGIENPTHFTAIDNAKSVVLETLTTLRKGKFDSEDDMVAKTKKITELRQKGYRQTSHCTGDQHYIEPGKSTLFINAAIESGEDFFDQVPWVVDLGLPRSNQKKRRRSRSDSKEFELAVESDEQKRSRHL